MKPPKFVDIKTYLFIGLGVISFSQFMIHLFGQTIPNIVWSFFREAGTAVILVIVFLFAFAWILKARPHNKPKNYTIVIFDVFNKEVVIDGIRTEFKTHDVAWSFMKQYKQDYPLNNFALVSQLPKSNKKTIFKYI